MRLKTKIFFGLLLLASICHSLPRPTAQGGIWTLPLAQPGSDRVMIHFKVEEQNNSTEKSQFNLIVTVEDISETMVTVLETNLNTASMEVYNPISIPRLGDIGDVDTTNLVNGSVLVYNVATSRWTSTTTFNAQTMEGGEF